MINRLNALKWAAFGAACCLVIVPPATAIGVGCWAIGEQYSADTAWNLLARLFRDEGFYLRAIFTGESDEA